MRQLDEHVFECSAALGESAHKPVAFNSQAENLFAHVGTLFHP